MNIEIAKAGLLTYSGSWLPSHPDKSGQWFSELRSIGDHSSGYCPGFFLQQEAPGSLFTG